MPYSSNISAYDWWRKELWCQENVGQRNKDWVVIYSYDYKKCLWLFVDEDKCTEFSLTWS